MNILSLEKEKSSRFNFEHIDMMIRRRREHYSGKNLLGGFNHQTDFKTNLSIKSQQKKTTYRDA